MLRLTSCLTVIVSLTGWRFRFFPQAGAFVVVNDWQQNAQLLVHMP